MSTRAPAKRRVCKDCLAEGVTTKRPAPHPGPRCTSHHRAVRTARRTSAHGLYVLKTYNLTEEQYWELYELQGGRCYICQRATGRAKRLAVDHDHSCCPETPACGRCVRGLTCTRCNRDVLGHLRDSIEALQRAIDYLKEPPAWKVIGRPDARSTGAPVDGSTLLPGGVKPTTTDGGETVPSMSFARTRRATTSRTGRRTAGSRKRAA